MRPSPRLRPGSRISMTFQVLYNKSDNPPHPALASSLFSKHCSPNFGFFQFRIWNFLPVRSFRLNMPRTASPRHPAYCKPSHSKYSLFLISNRCERKTYYPFPQSAPQISRPLRLPDNTDGSPPHSSPDSSVFPMIDTLSPPPD